MYSILPRALLCLTVSVAILLLSCLTIKMTDTSCLLNIFMFACWWQENKEQPWRWPWKKQPEPILSHSERKWKLPFLFAWHLIGSPSSQRSRFCLLMYQKPPGVAHIFFFFKKSPPKYSPLHFSQAIKSRGHIFTNKTFKVFIMFDNLRWRKK